MSAIRGAAWVSLLALGLGALVEVALILGYHGSWLWWLLAVLAVVLLAAAVASVLLILVFADQAEEDQARMARLALIPQDVDVDISLRARRAGW